MQKKVILLIFIYLLQNNIFSQECNSFKKSVEESVSIITALLDSTIYGNRKPEYFESLIIYPVLKRYYTKQKISDSAIVRKYSDLARTTWCYKSVCFNNNRTFYLNKKQILDKLNSNEPLNSYELESICMLCNQYVKDTTQIKKILDYYPNTNLIENENALNYGLLHKSLQLVNLKSGKCITNEMFNRYKLKLIDTIYRKFITPFLEPSGINNKFVSKNIDLYAEALLMISILDDNINISDELYELLLDMQMADKGWPSFTDSFNPNGHTTIVSLWVLLDLKKKHQKIK